MKSSHEEKSKQLPDPLKRFIADSKWTFAVTYAENWPHEYIVQDRVDNDLFLALAHHIDTYGYESKFYETNQMYFDYDGNTYWHMDNIINRCIETETYRRREAEGRLPKDAKNGDKQIHRIDIERRLVYGCGFWPFRPVDGKTSIQHIVKGSKSGIYVLAHKDGAYYVGLSVDLGNRFEQHVVDKRPIEAYAFREVHKLKLDKTETETISILKDMGVELTNTEKMGNERTIESSERTITQNEVAHWLHDNTWNDFSGTAPEALRPNGNVEDKFRNKFLNRLYAQDVLDFLTDYVGKCIIKPFQTAPSKWNVTCLPSTRYSVGEFKGNAVSLINVGNQYSVLIIDAHGALLVSFAVKKSVFRMAHPSGVVELKRYAPSVKEEKASVKALGDDQIEVIVPLSEAKEVLKDSGLVSAIRALVVHNNGMNISGSSSWTKYHCYSLAKEILRSLK